MGYRVGLQCFSNNEVATDYVMSSVAPIIRADGVLIKPEKIGEVWSINGQHITLNLPECDFIEQFQIGVSVGAPFVLLFAIMLCFKVVISMIKGGIINNDNLFSFYPWFFNCHFNHLSFLVGKNEEFYIYGGHLNGRFFFAGC